MAKYAVGPAMRRLWRKGIIKKDRKKLGITQTVFAEMIGVSTYTLSTWENGLSKPELEYMLLIYQALRVLKINKEASA